MSVDDPVLLVLDHVVGSGGPLAVSIIDHLSHVASRFPVRDLHAVCLHHEPLLQIDDTGRLEARQPRVVHLLDQVNDLPVVLSNGQIALDCFLDVKLVSFGVRRASKDLSVLISEFEPSRFKPHVFTWTPVEHKTEVNVHQVAIVCD